MNIGSNNNNKNLKNSTNEIKIIVFLYQKQKSEFFDLQLWNIFLRMFNSSFIIYNNNNN